MPGIEQPPVVPQVLPVQLLRVGAVAVLGIPGELTTMAGRRLRTSVLDAMSATGVTHLALGTYANEYAGYITTREEYSAQHYEGASTLFGPHTLEAHQQVAAQLATAIAEGKPSPPGAGRDPVDVPSTAPVPLPEPVELGGQAALLQQKQLVAVGPPPQGPQDD